MKCKRRFWDTEIKFSYNQNTIFLKKKKKNLKMFVLKPLISVWLVFLRTWNSANVYRTQPEAPSFKPQALIWGQAAGRELKLRCQGGDDRGRGMWNLSLITSESGLKPIRERFVAHSSENPCRGHSSDGAMPKLWGRLHKSTAVLRVHIPWKCIRCQISLNKS